MVLILLLAWLLALPGGVPFEAPPAAAHRFHLSYGRVAVEGAEAYSRVRFFAHDFEAALRQYHEAPDFRLAVNPRSDSLAQAYLDEHLQLEADGVLLDGEIVASGEEDDMWWYTVRVAAAQPIHKLTLRNTILFDLFEDQKNIVRIQHFPSEERFAFYFIDGAESYTVTL